MTAASRYQRGMALITSMLLLVVVTILALAMFRSYGTQEKIAGNVREKQRAFSAAVSAQQYAEWYITNNALPATVVCAAGMIPTVQVCNAAAGFTTTPWGTGTNFVQFTQDSGNGVTNNVNMTAARDTYVRQPAFYITDLGSGGTGEIYQVDAVGYGASDNAVAVVESTFLVSAMNSRWLDK